ncbi:MAG: hypothetical protein WC676_05550 [Candidatus Omnitrophota bacterium]
MSLKIFHIVFIICSVALSVSFGFWSGQFYHETREASYLTMSVLAFVFAVILIVYGARKFSQLGQSK